MSLLKTLETRSNTSCELCSSPKDLTSYAIEPSKNDDENDHILICNTCKEQIENPDTMDANHWRCLNDSMWSEVKAVQVMVYRILFNLRNEGWPQGLLDMLYLDEETLAWAKDISDEKLIHKDSNGVVLENGDSVVLIKD